MKLLHTLTHRILKKNRIEITKRQENTQLYQDNKLLSDGWLQPKTASELLSTPLRQKLIKNIYQSVSMSEAMFNTLYHKAIEQYAELVQELPASETHHHAHLGGMLDHGLEVICFAVKLRQNYLLPPNSAPEEQAQQSEAWTGAVIYSALIHDIAKILTDMEIETTKGRWYLWQGKINTPYRFKHIKDRDYHLHPTMGSYITNYLLSPLSLDWLAKYPEAFSSYFYLAAGHYDKAGLLGEIIQQADKMSVSLYLGGDTTKLKQPQKSFANQILTALRYLIENDLQLNNEKSGSDGWLTDEGLWLVSKTVTDKIRAYLMQQGISVPAQNSKLFDEMQAHRLIEATPDNKAIWNAQIKSNAGWQPQISFTLLKVSPSLIWDSIDKRPTVFNGIVIVNNQSEQKNTDDDNSGTDVNNIIPIDTQEKKFNDSFDFALNLFNTPDNTEQKQDEQKKENSVTNELVHATEKISTLSDTITLLTDNTDQINTEINAEKFVEWLKTSLANDTFPINEPQAKIHFVNDCIFLVTPGIFQVYCQTTAGNTNSWRELQKQFQRLNLHKKKQPGNFNIWTCIIKGDYKTSRVKGYLIENIEFFTNKQYFNNMYLTLQDVNDGEKE
ncbi:MobH family relaxase [Gallibacterium anatis]|uniref:Helicase n=1 Tax=Gallibacterium anatis TaxID=750 RepID=A0A1A7P845_9PAST|nr:MobH family relaxase [Gallibacterium anatis]OBW96881.1 helicase [Gallibacterium anatis]OBW98218.1 helicase [Gallibacterium anatis]